MPRILIRDATVVTMDDRLGDLRRASVLLQSGLANIDSVRIAGEWQKRSGKLTAGNVSRHLTQLRASGERILNAMGIAIGAS